MFSDATRCSSTVCMFMHHFEFYPSLNNLEIEDLRFFLSVGKDQEALLELYERLEKKLDDVKKVCYVTQIPCQMAVLCLTVYTERSLTEQINLALRHQLFTDHILMQALRKFKIAIYVIYLM